MSGPFQRPYPPNRQETNPGSVGSPLTPSTSDGPAPSFKTNVNRTKTKRWVEAKSYSYDGDDWGDDDEYEDEEEAPPVPPPAKWPPNDARSRSASAHGGDRSILQDRVREERGRHASSSGLNTNIPNALSESADAAATQSPVFIRPADIYKRMQEEREKERKSHETARSGSESVGPTSQVGAPPRSDALYTEPNRDQITSSALEQPRSNPALALPEVKRLSDFGQDFMSTPSQSSQVSEPAEHITSSADQSQAPGLHHNPSAGFRSAVNQAFDVPPTPSSTIDSVVRSNSDSTSVISPIMSHPGLDGEKTPTIAEDPGESAAEASGQEGYPPYFQPGHRRDLTIPAPGNGPERVLAMSDAQQTPQSELAETSFITPSQSQETVDKSAEPENAKPAASQSTPEGNAWDGSDVHPSIEYADQQPSESVHAPTPTPLRIPSGQQPAQLSSASAVTEIVPAMSTDTSPQDLESDRLRKEIIRSFSPSETDGPVAQQQSEPQTRPRYESTYLPSEYDSYWNEQPDVSSTSPLQPRPPVSFTEPLSLTVNPKSPTENTSADTTLKAGKSDSQRPRLKKRFSWEESDDSEKDALKEITAIPPVPTADLESPPELKETSSELQSIAPEPTASRSNEQSPTRLSGEFGPKSFEKEVVLGQVESSPEEPRNTSTFVSPHQQSQLQLPQASGPAGSEPKLPRFRQILEIQSPEQRIQTFKDTREQFALIDSGLSNWIQVTAESLPEHADIVQLNGHLPAGAHRSLPQKAKFPKLASLGNLSLAASSNDDTLQVVSPGHARKPSGSPLSGVIHRSNVESKGKDLLHSAGVLGGRAGGAARGLFAKGRNKFRTGGADKGSLSIFGPRRRSLPPGEDTNISNLDLEKPAGTQAQHSSTQYQGVPRLPSFKFHERSFSNSFDDERVFTGNGAIDLSSGPHAEATLRNSLRSVPEEAYSWLRLDGRPSTDSSLTRRMLQSDGITEDTASSFRFSPESDLCSAHGPRSVDIPNSDEAVGKPNQDTGKQHLDSRPQGFSLSVNDSPGGSVISGSMDKPASDVEVRVIPSTQTEPTPSSPEVSPMTVVEENEREASRKTEPAGTQELAHTLSNFHGLRQAIPEEADSSVSLASDVILPFAGDKQEPISNDQTQPASAEEHDPESNSEFGRSESAAQRSDSGDEDHVKVQIVAHTPQPASAGDVSRDDEDRSDNEFQISRHAMEGLSVSPMLMDMSKRLSSTSQVSLMDQEEMDAIRVKFDDKAPGSTKRSESSKSRISEISQDLGDVEKQDGNAYNPQPAQIKAVTVLRDTEIPASRGNHLPALNVSTGQDHDLQRMSRFSFESEGNRHTEEVLTLARRDREQMGDHPNLSAARMSISQYLSQTHVPGETVSDELPPPFSEPGADYLEDKKVETDEAPPYSPNHQFQALPAGIDVSIAQQRPISQSVQSPPGYQPASPTGQHDPSWRMSAQQSHSKTSSASSVDPRAHDHRFPAGPQTPTSGAQHKQRPEQVTRTPENQLTPSGRSSVLLSPDDASRWVYRNHGDHSRVPSGQDSAAARNIFLGPLSVPDSDSLDSGDSMVVNAAASRLDLRVEPSPLNQQTEFSPPNTQPLKTKFKKIGKLPRASSSATVKPPEIKKGTFSLISGLFKPNTQRKPDSPEGRWHTAHHKNYPQDTASWYGYDSPSVYPPHHNGSPVLEPGPRMQQVRQPPNNHGSFIGQPPPSGGYYAPGYGPDEQDSSYGYPTPGQQMTSPGHVPNSGFHYPPPHLPAFRHSNEYSVSSSYQYPYSPPSQGHSSPSLHSGASPVSTFAPTWSSQSPPQLKRGRSRAQDLHMRSRSPRAHPVRGEERNLSSTNYYDPAHMLGKFKAIPPTPRIGDQQRPYSLALPEDPEDGRGSRRPSWIPVQQHIRTTSGHGLGLQGAPSPRLPSTVEHEPARSQPVPEEAAVASSSDPPRSQTQPETASPAVAPCLEKIETDVQSTEAILHRYEDGPVNNKTTSPVEMPVPGDDSSEEEIVMSSSAYPGQEWQPSGYEYWMPY